MGVGRLASCNSRFSRLIFAGNLRYCYLPNPVRIEISRDGDRDGSRFTDTRQLDTCNVIKYSVYARKTTEKPSKRLDFAMSGPSSQSNSKEKVKVVIKKQRWYLGGIASAMAAACTHPLDLLKVHLQTQQNVQTGLVGMGINVVKVQGIRGLYTGLTASMMRQLTYSTTRYGLYEIGSRKLRKGDEPLPFYQKAIIGGSAGFIGGFLGNPADIINVRMQNDIKLPLEQRRNYKHVFHGLYKSGTQEGVSIWMKGVSMTSTRALLITFAQVACYDQVKQTLLHTGFFYDNMVTHFTSSFIAGTIATGVTQPFDVMKTRLMEARPGQYKNALQCFIYTAKLGPKGFYKGFIPSWVRIAPYTILTWLILEQLRKLFPYK